MSKKKKVLCPYCGERMEFQDGLFSMAWLKCPKCNSCGPVAKGDSQELRRANAFSVARRMPHETKTEKQKPLTLGELRKADQVWIELLDPYAGLRYTCGRSTYYSVRSGHTPNGQELICGIPKTEYRFLFSDYGKSWIAFRREPTEEERKAAKRRGDADA